ncbi:hypothetical protein ACFV1N_38160 [Streptosporangium canum]|uniref:hypothetical protein n=1 Tax=Streptosporangium canum TaxID=324952 RepID=UPI003677920B
MTKPSITARIRRAHAATAHLDNSAAGTVALLAIFPDEAFRNAPTWSPGDAFHPIQEERSWIYRRPDSRIEGVAVVWPKEQPAHDGGPWTQDEVWHVLFPSSGAYVGDLWDKAHRMSWLARDPADSRIISRTPISQHPLRHALHYWEEFEDRHGFYPRLLDHGAVLLGSDRRWLSLKYSPHRDRYTGLEEFIATAGWLHRRFDARIHIYPWNPQTRRTASPYPYAHLNANPFGGAIGDLLRRQTARW